MKKIIAGILVVLALGTYFWWSITKGSTTTTVPTPTTTTYKDGSYTGAVADAFYGPLQVTTTIQGGVITDITYPQFPDGPETTKQKSAMSLPILKSEAITVQSAQVDIVSGATQTSEAFQQSLGSALAQAQS